MKLPLLLAGAVSSIALAACGHHGGTTAGADNSAAAASAAATTPAPLKLAVTTEFPGYTGDFDHFAIDTKDGRLFLAGEEYHELEVLDRQREGRRHRLCH